MKEFALILLCLVDVVPSCGKRYRPHPPLVAGTAEHPRSIDVTVSNLGFTPSRLSGRPGEALRLIFHYEPSAGECGHEVVLPKQNLRFTLSEKQPVEVPLTLPADRGEVEWSCGMNMLHGKIVVE
jgi:plastocyanin domain-containing protein